MHRIGLIDYYVFEPTLLSNMTICMPTQWFKKDGIMLCRAWKMTPRAGGWVIVECDEITFPETMLSMSFDDLQHGAYLCPGLPSAGVS